MSVRREPVSIICVLESRSKAGFEWEPLCIVDKDFPNIHSDHTAFRTRRYVPEVESSEATFDHWIVRPSGNILKVTWEQVVEEFVCFAENGMKINPKEESYTAVLIAKFVRIRDDKEFKLSEWVPSKLTDLSFYLEEVK